jgi:hypothetical protein
MDQRIAPSNYPCEKIPSLLAKLRNDKPLADKIGRLAGLFNMDLAVNYKSRLRRTRAMV